MSFETTGLKRLAVVLTAAALVAACGSSSESTTTTAASGTSTAPTTPTTAPTLEPTTTLPGFPPERAELGHGDPTWAVVLAGASDPEDPSFVEAELIATEAGYTTGFTDCDEGAAEALGMPAGTITTSVYFETEADARAAAVAFAARGVDGVVAEVRTFCLD